MQLAIVECEPGKHVLTLKDAQEKNMHFVTPDSQVTANATCCEYL